MAKLRYLAQRMKRLERLQKGLLADFFGLLAIAEVGISDPLDRPAVCRDNAPKRVRIARQYPPYRRSVSSPLKDAHAPLSLPYQTLGP